MTPKATTRSQAEEAPAQPTITIADAISVRELAEMMLEIALEFPEYSPGAKQVTLVDVSSSAYYGEGYQDIQTRVPWIENTRQELDWEPQVDVRNALRGIFEAYRHEVSEASALLDD